MCGKKGTGGAGLGGQGRAGLSLRFPAEHRKQGVPPRKGPEAWEFVKTDDSALHQHLPFQESSHYLKSSAELTSGSEIHKMNGASSLISTSA